MDFSVEHPYDCSPARLHTVLTDRDYLNAKFPAIGFRDVTVTAATPAHVENSRVLQAPLPGFARKVLGETQTVEQVEDWTAHGDGFRGTFTAKAKGTPVTLRGTLAITPDGDGALLRIAGKADVKIPLVGGKIASLVADQAVQNLEREYTFTRQWLTEHP